MARHRSIPGQRDLFPADPAVEVIGALKSLPDGELVQAVRVGAYDLIRRKLAVPVALPVAEAVMGIEYSVPSAQF